MPRSSAHSEGAYVDRKCPFTLASARVSPRGIPNPREFRLISPKGPILGATGLACVTSETRATIYRLPSEEEHKHTPPVRRCSARSSAINGSPCRISRVASSPNDVTSTLIDSRLDSNGISVGRPASSYFEHASKRYSTPRARVFF